MRGAYDVTRPIPCADLEGGGSGLSGSPIEFAKLISPILVY